MVPGILNSQGTTTTGVTGAVSNTLILTGSGVNGAGALTNTSPYVSMFTGGITLDGPTAGTTATTTINTGAAGIILTGSITDNNAGDGLNKTGSGTLYLLGPSNYTGGTTVSAGTLQIGYGSNSGSILGDVSVSSGATLAFDRPTWLPTRARLPAAAASRRPAYGTLVLNNTADNYTGPTNVNNGGILSVYPAGLGGHFGDQRRPQRHEPVGPVCRQYRLWGHPGCRHERQLGRHGHG